MAEWDVPSLCTGWRVRDVAAHLTLAHVGRARAAWELVRARCGFDRMIHDSAVREAAAHPPGEFAARLRGMVGRGAARSDEGDAAGCRRGSRHPGLVSALLLLSTGRDVALSRLSGPGAAALAARLAPRSAGRPVSP